MKGKKQKRIILALIKDDINSTRLLHGLRALGFNTDAYLLHLGDSIFMLMGFKADTQSDRVFEYYLYLTQRAVQRCQLPSAPPLDALAHEIYQALQSRQRRQA